MDYLNKPKKIYCSELTLGSSFENQPFVIDTISSKDHDPIYLTISDKTGTANATISRQLAESIQLFQNIGKAFFISAAVLVEQKQPLIVIRSIAECKDIQPSELYSGLSSSMVSTYTQAIMELKERVKNENYKALLMHCLSEENVRRLSLLPASHSAHGVYIGGCLAATAVITDLSLYLGVRYIRLSNQLYSSSPNWDLLITSGLLHTFGSLYYFDEKDPFKKSVMGIRMNYFPILQSALERTILKNDLMLTEEEFGNLINVLQVAVSSKTSTRAITKEGTILRHTLSLYRECDILDCQKANHFIPEGEEFFYDRRSRRYLINQPKEEES